MRSAVLRSSESGGAITCIAARETPALERGTAVEQLLVDLKGYRFVTVKPGPVPHPDGGMQAPHIDVSVFARGLLKRVVTRIYFPNEQEANESDPVLSSVEPAQRAALAQYDAALRRVDRLLGRDLEVGVDRCPEDGRQRLGQALVGHVDVAGDGLQLPGGGAQAADPSEEG